MNEATDTRIATAPRRPHGGWRTGGVILAATLAAATLGGCGSKTGPVAAASTPPATSASPTPTIAPTAPASAECTAFAQAYNSSVSPVLKGTGATGNVYLNQLTDAFTALAGTAASGTDAYSQTITTDARAVAADPTSLGALATFNTDLAQFLKACGMSAGT